MTGQSAEHAIAWGFLEPGANVISSDGQKVGEVIEVIGDRSMDIFSGVAFKQGLLGKEGFAPADKVERITTASVSLSISGSEAEALEPYAR